ncbi:DUF6470 family protein [Anaeroselena agilis]|uniref:DUF6470 family protein n=1 Tax=Anaeroselena agilis TaxID=3063788 RepID=A0ABU3P4F0_9FIRM|nr:DUF6470 family protein [Selenomonadales bacterium 4137-cl]
MSRLLLTIDQTPCRASYGILGHEAFRRDLVAKQRGVVQEAIANYVSRGDRLSKAAPGNSIPDLAAELYLSKPVPQVALVPVERPVIGLAEVSVIDMVI